MLVDNNNQVVKKVFDFSAIKTRAVDSNFNVTGEY